MRYVEWVQEKVHGNEDGDKDGDVDGERRTGDKVLSQLLHNTNT